VCSERVGENSGAVSAVPSSKSNAIDTLHNEEWFGAMVVSSSASSAITVSKPVAALVAKLPSEVKKAAGTAAAAAAAPVNTISTVRPYHHYDNLNPKDSYEIIGKLGEGYAIHVNSVCSHVVIKLLDFVCASRFQLHCL